MFRYKTKRIRNKGGRQQIRIQKAPIHETRHTPKDEKASFMVINIFCMWLQLISNSTCNLENKEARIK